MTPLFGANHSVSHGGLRLGRLRSERDEARAGRVGRALRRGASSLLPIALLALAAGQVRAEATSSASDPAARGAAAIDRVRSELGAALKRALAQGPLHAIDVCRVEAPRIAAALSREGIAVGRTSRKLRNPSNAPEPWMEPLLDAYASDESAPGGPRSVDLGARGTGVVAPIRVQPLCTTCHGETLAPELQEQLGTLYPDDRATGYAVGDFRGLFWAEVPPDPASP